MAAQEQEDENEGLNFGYAAREAPTKVAYKGFMSAVLESRLER